MRLPMPGAVVSAVTPKIAAQLNYEDELKSAEDPYSKREELEKRYMDDVADGVHAAQLLRAWSSPVSGAYRVHPNGFLEKAQL